VIENLANCTTVNVSYNAFPRNVSSTAWSVGYVKRILTEERTENFIPGSANSYWIYGYFLVIHILLQFSITCEL